jgi:phytanoyl-CoA dioxygenase PhyH
MSHPAIEEAHRLHADGHWSDAIDLLVRTNREARDGSVEIALADLRHEAWAQIAGSPDEARVEPAPAAPPIGPSGLPEGTFGELTAADVRAAVMQHGSLLIPHAIPPDVVDAIRDSIDVGIDAATASDAGDTCNPSIWRPLKLHPDVVASMSSEHRPLRRSFVHEAGGVLLADSPHAMFELHETFERLGLREIVTEYLGARAVMSAHKSTLRKVSPSAVGGWHQDGSFLGSDLRAINIWIALTPCGVDAPGLDIVPRRLDEIVPTGTEGSYFSWAVSELTIDEIAGDFGVVRPMLNAGDIVIFDEMLLHRTAVTPEMTVERHAVEFWCFSPASYPAGQIPVVW